MPTYTVTAPSGRVMELTGDHPPTERELLEIFSRAGQPVNAASPIKRDARGLPAVSSGASDSPEAPTWKDNLGAAMEASADPRTLDDVGHLLMAPVDATRGMVANLPAVARGARDIVESVPQAVRAARSGASSVMGAAGEGLDNAAVGAMNAQMPYVGKLLKWGARVIKPGEAATPPQGAPPVVAGPPPPMAAPAAAGPAQAPVQAPMQAPPVAAEPAPVQAPAPAPPAPAPAGPFNPSAAVQAARDVFKATSETPRPAELSNAMELMRRGASPEQAVARVIEMRGGAANAASELHVVSDRTGHSTVYRTADKRYMGSFDTPEQAQRFVAGQSAPAVPAASDLKIVTYKNGKATVYSGPKERYVGSFDTVEEAQRFVDSAASPIDRLAKMPGMMSDAERIAAQDARHVSGKVKSPSAETARARRR